MLIPPMTNDSQSALLKLLFFTFLMVSGPIGTYFLSLKHVWGGAPVPRQDGPVQSGAEGAH